MEYGVFPTQDFQEVLEGYVEARLHNDGKVRNSEEFTPEAKRVRALQQELVGHLALPYYLVMDPADQEILARHTLSLVDQEKKLLDFLRRGRELWLRRQERS